MGRAGATQRPWGGGKGNLDSEQCRIHKIHKNTTKNRWLLLLLDDKITQIIFTLLIHSVIDNSKPFGQEYLYVG